jgi:hypothetical protein
MEKTVTKLDFVYTKLVFVYTNSVFVYTNFIFVYTNLVFVYTKSVFVYTNFIFVYTNLVYVYTNSKKIEAFYEYVTVFDVFSVTNYDFMNTFSKSMFIKLNFVIKITFDLRHKHEFSERVYFQIIKKKYFIRFFCKIFPQKWEIKRDFRILSSNINELT